MRARIIVTTKNKDGGSSRMVLVEPKHGPATLKFEQLQRDAMGDPAWTEEGFPLAERDTLLVLAIKALADTLESR